MQSGRLKPFPTRCPDRRDILACGPVSGHELAEAQVPVLIPGPPALRDALCGQIEHPAQGIIAGEAGLIFRDLAKLAVQALDHVGRVYGLPNLSLTDKIMGPDARASGLLYELRSWGRALPRPIRRKSGVFGNPSDFGNSGVFWKTGGDRAPPLRAAAAKPKFWMIRCRLDVSSSGAEVDRKFLS